MPGHDAEQEELARQLTEWARRMSGAGNARASEDRTPGDDRATSDRAEGGVGAPGDGLSELPVLFMLSGLRLWTRCAEVWMRLGIAVAQNVSRIQPDAGTGKEAQDLLIAEFRSGLRELTAVSSQESRRLEAELEKVTRRNAGDVPGGEPGPYWRRWEVKP